jgi:antirestriction protein ArdC
MIMSNRNSKALHEIVASTIIEKLKQGTAPWQMPWNSTGPSFTLPYNALTGNRYKGINILSLLSAERNDPRWLTFKQADSKGYTVNKGEKATLIQYVKTHNYLTQTDEKGKIIHDQDGKPKKYSQKLDRPIITTAWVFNAEQISGIEPLKIKEMKTTNWKSLERIENLIDQSKAQIFHTHEDRAYYSATKDQIIMPYRTQFDAADKYYATILHEMGHWTSHHDRLDRDILNKFGTEGYAREELRAEIASMLLGHELNIGHDPTQHIAYVDSWIKLLKDSPYEIHAAAVDAEKIMSYIMAFDIQREIKTSNNKEEKYTSVANNYSTLTTGEVIDYNNTSYKIESQLKNGRYKVEDLSTGNNFILSKSDGLYTSLISAKSNTNIIPINS